MRKHSLFVFIMLITFTNLTIIASDQGGIGVRAGIGTDASGGIAFGGGINYLINYDQSALEIGIILYSGSFEEETTEAINTYMETTDVFVFGAMANYLYKYDRTKNGLYYIVGFGLGMIEVEWEERSDGDNSLGTPLPGGGSMQSAEGTSAGTIINLGIGYTLSPNFDLRVEIPMILTFDAPGESSQFIPTLAITAGYRF